MSRGDLANIEANPAIRSLRDVMPIDVLADASDIAAWSATDSTDAGSLAASTTHLLGSQGLSFDKAAGTTDAGISRSLSGGAALDGSARFSLSDLVELALLIPSGVSIDEIVLRLGADSSNYAEWVFPAGEIIVGEWSKLAAEIAAQDPTLQAGNGLNLNDIQFVQIIVRTALAADTFIGAILDNIVIRGN